jgi:hypothetical protein
MLWSQKVPGRAVFERHPPEGRAACFLESIAAL